MDLPASIAVQSAIAVALAVTLLWLVSVARRDVSIVDIFWGPGFAIIAWISYAAASDAGRSLLLAILTTVWAVRLGGYLAWRNLGKPEDYRYRAMRAGWDPGFWWKSLFIVFALQGLLMFVVSLPLQQTATSSRAWSWLDGVGLVLWAGGLLMESIGDWQLARFKSDPANRGKVLDQGLWRYTRHPNYFGDFLVWWGVYLIATAGGAPWWTVIGPLVMSVLLMRVSGVALLERSLKESKPGYADYVRRTSAFFPWPPKSHETAPVNAASEINAVARK
jgi:steroid 5-alpha reductase family enzyme